jgi:hypothetical protein
VNAIDPAVSAFHPVPLAEYTSISVYPQMIAAALLPSRLCWRRSV